MSKRFNNITLQLTADDESTVPPNVIERSRFLQVAASFNLSVIVGPAADGLKPDESIGRLWSDIAPEGDGYTFEIATSLPYHLPTFDEHPEYVVGIRESELVVSSRMIRCFYSAVASDHEPLRYLLVHRLAMQQAAEANGFTSVHPIPIPTFVSKRLRCVASTAEQAVQDNFYQWSEDLRHDVARLLEVLRNNCAHLRHLLPQIGAPAYPVYWLMVAGRDQSVATAQLCTDMCAYAPRTLTKIDCEEAEVVRTQLASGEPSSVNQSALALARTFLNYRLLDLAIVQVCVACEALLGHMYHAFLMDRGVGNKQLRDNERDITFSQLLNLHLFTACDMTKQANREELLVELNWARRERNKVVHGDKLAVTPDRVERAIEAAIGLRRIVVAQWPSLVHTVVTP